MVQNRLNRDSFQILSSVIIQELLADLRSTIGSLYKLSEAVSMLDLLISLAEVSKLQGFVK